MYTNVLPDGLPNVSNIFIFVRNVKPQYMIKNEQRRVSSTLDLINLTRISRFHFDIFHVILRAGFESCNL